MHFITFGSLLLFPLIFPDRVSAQDTIYWSTHHKLRWDDFQGIPDTTVQYEALTFSGIECKYAFTDTSFTYKVAAFFLPNESWKVPWAENITLKHEQLHFDISEVFARKLNTQLSKLNPNRATVKKVVGDLVQKIMDEKEDMQNQYDRETDFGRKTALQQEWQKKIMILLAQKK